MVDEKNNIDEMSLTEKEQYLTDEEITAKKIKQLTEDIKAVRKSLKNAKTQEDIDAFNAEEVRLQGEIEKLTNETSNNQSSSQEQHEQTGSGEQYNKLLDKHKDLRISVQQNKIKQINEIKELQKKHEEEKTKHLDKQKELQSKYEIADAEATLLASKAQALEKSLTTTIEDLKEECRLKIKQTKEATEEEAERRLRELKTKHGTNEQVRSEIIKLALSHLGYSAPENFKADAFYNAILSLYDFIKKDLLTRHSWRFAVGECLLDKAIKQQHGIFSFAHELPKNILKLQKVIPICDYEIVGNLLWCPTDKVTLFYIKQVEDVTMPEFFKTLLVYSLAAASSAIVTQNEVIARKWEAEANQRFCTAIANDMAQQVTHGIIRNKIYTAHF
ncbi:hypothetical protein GAMM_260014 [Gammaproteobacteria bacterium]